MYWQRERSQADGSHVRLLYYPRNIIDNAEGQSRREALSPQQLLDRTARIVGSFCVCCVCHPKWSLCGKLRGLESRCTWCAPQLAGWIALCSSSCVKSATLTAALIVLFGLLVRSLLVLGSSLIKTITAPKVAVVPGVASPEPR